MLSGAAKLEPEDPVAGVMPLGAYHDYQVVSIDGPCSQVLDELVTLYPATFLVFSFPLEYLHPGSRPNIRLTLSGRSIKSFSISFALASLDLMNSRFPLLGRALFVAQAATPLGEFDARLQIAWGEGAICPFSDVTFRLATITGNPADPSILGIAEVPTVEDSASSGRNSAAEGAARVGCALNSHTSSSTSSLVWSFLCVVLLGLSLVSIRVRS